MFVVVGIVVLLGVVCKWQTGSGNNGSGGGWSGSSGGFGHATSGGGHGGGFSGGGDGGCDGVVVTHVKTARSDP